MPDNQPATPDSAGVDRTATGAIADKAQTTTPAATTPQTTTTTEATSPPSEDKSLVNQTEKSLANQAPPAAGDGAPDAYEAFNVPEGYILDEETAKEAGGIFKTMNLTQTQAQKLVDFYVAKTNDTLNQPYEAWRQTQQKWVQEVKNDPFMGPRLNHVTSTISKAIDVVAKNNPALAEGFRSVMDFTGAGNNPHFIRMFYEMASLITEGGHVAGRGPSPVGQQAPGQGVPTAARAMYPNLP